MRFKSVGTVAWLVGVALAALLLKGCGGGGGGGDGGGGNPPPDSGLSGRLWHSDFALDSRDGTQIASPSGAAPSQVTARLLAWPWPDGSQYATADWNVSDDYTDVAVSAQASGAMIYQVRFTGGYLRGVKPSPVNKQVILATWGADSVSPSIYGFYDLAKLTVLDSFDTGSAAVNWLPDGRYIHITADGAISVGSVGGTRQATGQLVVPAGRTVNNVWVNRQGTKMVVQIWRKLDTGTIDQSDLWVANIDGTEQGQLTNTKLTSYGKWSPDGKNIGFDVDTGLACGGGGCSGSCGLWYASVDARNVLALQSSGDAFKFNVKNSSGAERALGCELLAWTD